MTRCRPLLVFAVAWGLGCSNWPTANEDPSGYVTPSRRIEAIQQIASHATATDSPEQQQYTSQLALQIQQEPDPLVREAIVRAIAEFRTPMAQRVLEAGLADEDQGVRIACCKALGRRGDRQAAATLGRSLREDGDLDVRVAATRALGQLRAPEAVPELLAALEDRDPALQYAGVEAMRTATGEELGTSVSAWREYALARRQVRPAPTPPGALPGGPTTLR